MALTSAAVGLGVGIHVVDVAPENSVSLAQTVLAVDVFYIWGLAWSKLSLLLLYYRTFRFGYIKHASYGVGVLVVGWAITSTALVFVVCVPLSKLWDSSVVEGHCSDSASFRLTNAVATIVTDVVILCLPMPCIWGLHTLGRADKIGLSAVFGLGILLVTLPRHTPTLRATKHK